MANSHCPTQVLSHWKQWLFCYIFGLPIGLLLLKKDDI
nr:MAG TPA: hypothetical protein [Caudoviricetes sp.]